MKRVDDVSQFSESPRPLNASKKEKALQPERVARLVSRVVGWSVYASVVWAAVWRFALGDAVSALTIPWILAAVFCVSNGATAFAVSAYFRSRGEIGVVEVFYAIWARTGVFGVVALAFVVSGESTAVRAGLKALLVVYFATAPLHLAAIFPTDERRSLSWKRQAKEDKTDDYNE